MNFEMHFVTKLNLHYIHVLSTSFTRNLFYYQSSGFLRLLGRSHKKLSCSTKTHANEPLSVINTTLE